MTDKQPSAMKILVSLTPGGSEFVDNPKRCVEFVNDRLQTVTELAKERNKLRDVNKELLEALERHSQASATNPCHSGPSCKCIWHMTEAAILKAKG